jgi:hypothetical protein
MFPTANSTIILNEDGEPMGFETNFFDDPYYRDDYLSEDPEPYLNLWGDQAACEEADFHGNDGEGTDRENIFTCTVCGEDFTLND